MSAPIDSNPKPLAVFDLGKTNSKLFIFSPEGEILTETRVKPIWKTVGDIRVLDTESLEDWMRQSLATAIAEHGVDRMTFSGHGCTFALIDGDRLAHPVLDYEQEPPPGVAARIDGLVPDFSETFSPNLPLGFNYGRHILWLKDRDKAMLERTDAILAYPQFWTWVFSGRKVSEVSYIGCHSHLWAPLSDDFSSLVDQQGWREKMPAFVRSGEAVGFASIKLANGEWSDVAVHNGVHDSNSSLYYYRSIGFTDFTLVSTGTWVIIFNAACPLNALDRHRDMLANVTVDHQPTATIRFMGGREYDIASNGWNEPISEQALAKAVAASQFALPSFAPGGPFPIAEGNFTGEMPEGEQRAAVALLYVALMTDLSLDLIQSSNPIVLDGGLVKTGLYASLLAALRPQQDVLVSANAEGSAFGAAALAFESIGITPFSNQCERSEPLNLRGLQPYRDAWRKLIGRQSNSSDVREPKGMKA